MMSLLVFWVAKPYGIVGDIKLSEEHTATIFRAKGGNVFL
jgi:hypothetical protein